jgi:predicted O-methyltransferase YrrM
MQLVNPAAERYAEEFTTNDDALLQKVYENTVAAHPHAHMVSGPVQGRLLSMLSELFQPTYILEIGSFTGFSAICLAQGLRECGQLHTIELREADARTCVENFALSSKNKQIHLHIGNALDVIPALPYTWDMVFIDADKTSYISYYELVVPRLSEQGVIIADNVLFHGQVLEEKIKGKNALAMDAFNRHVAADSRTQQVLLTLRDGVMLIKKRKQ